VVRADVISRESGGAGVAHWSPHQLRHSYATRMRAIVGIEVTSTLLGHASVPMTEVYAERDRARAANIAEKYG
jgi:integrase